MAALTRCTQFSGALTLLDSEPATFDFSDVIYVPADDPVSRSGLFDHGRKLILQSVSFRGANPLATPQRLGTEYALEGVRDLAPDPLYLYGGVLHDQLGHFLLSSLSRFWSPVFAEHPDAKILVHSSVDLDVLFGDAWRATIFEGLGLGRDRFVRFARPTRIGRIIVPSASFEQEHFGHRVFARSGQALGRRLAAPWIGGGDPGPVYLSLRDPAADTATLENEAAIAAVLERAGVEIVDPLKLEFARLVALWHDRSMLVSFSSPALHAGILAPGRALLTVGLGDTLSSNHWLVDRLSGARAQYLRPLGDAIVPVSAPAAADGVTAFVARDPVGIAEDILRALDFRQRAARQRTARARSGNLALDQPTRMSTPGRCDDAADSPVNGILTGSVQLRTGQSENSWWEVDLPGPASIDRIRLYNRVDGDTARPGRFSIALYLDGPFFRVVHRQAEPIAFGGLDGAPFDWRAPEPVTARRVRIALHGPGALELDQVEVIGRLL